MDARSPFRLPAAIQRGLTRHERLIVRQVNEAPDRLTYLVELEGLPLTGRGPELQSALDSLDAKLIQAEKIAGLERLRLELLAFDPKSTRRARSRN